jgi:hypothetical protein
MRDVAGIWRMTPRLIARAGPLNLDHLRTHVGEHLAAHGTRNHLRVLDDLQIAQGLASQSITSVLNRGDRAWDAAFNSISPTPYAHNRRFAFG